jgi:uncharacterized membrane protein
MKKELSNISGGIVALILGLFVTLIATGVIHSDDASFHAPRWMFALCGALFMIAGLVMLTAQYRTTRKILVVLLIATFFIVAVWVCLFTKPDTWSGGLPFLSRNANGLIAKTAVGFGAVLLLLMLVKAVSDLWHDRDS